jgi:hypothetical protein
MAFDPHNHIAQQRALFGPSNSPYNSNPYASIDSGSFDANFLERITVPLGLSSQDLSREGLRRRRLIDEQNLRFREDIHAMANGAGSMAVSGVIGMGAAVVGGLVNPALGFASGAAGTVAADYFMEKADVFDREQLAAGHAIRRGFAGRRGAQVLGLNGRITGEQAFGIAGGFQSMAKSHFSKPVGGVSFNTNDLVQLTSMFNEMGTLDSQGSQSSFFKNIKKKIESFRQLMVDMDMGKDEAMAFNKEIDRMGIHNSTQFAAGMGRAVRSVAGSYGMQTQSVMNWFARGMNSGRRSGFTPMTAGLFSARTTSSLYEAESGFEDTTMAYRHGGMEQLGQSINQQFTNLHSTPAFQQFLLSSYDGENFDFSDFTSGNSKRINKRFFQSRVHGKTIGQVRRALPSSLLKPATLAFLNMYGDLDHMKNRKARTGGNKEALRREIAHDLDGAIDPETVEALWAAASGRSKQNIFQEKMDMAGAAGGYKAIEPEDFVNTGTDPLFSTGLYDRLTFAVGTDLQNEDSVKAGLQTISGAAPEALPQASRGGKRRPYLLQKWVDEKSDDPFKELSRFSALAGRSARSGMNNDFINKFGSKYASHYLRSGETSGMEYMVQRNFSLMSQSKKFQSMVGMSTELTAEVNRIGKMSDPSQILKSIAELMEVLEKRAGEGNLAYQVEEGSPIKEKAVDVINSVVDGLGKLDKALKTITASKMEIHP